MPLRAVIYARFSCSKQREASIEDQLAACRKWCEQEGYEVVAEYCDHAKSGRTDDRPQFQEMIANAGESDIVLVYMMDRFSRDPYDAPLYKHELSRRGVKLVSAMEQIPESPEGIIYEKLLEGLAACESRKTAVRTLRGMSGNAKKCLTNGVRVYGYETGEDGRFKVVPEQAEIVREVFARRLERESMGSIAADLAARGVKTMTGRPCSGNMVNRMLHNEKYLGTYSWGGETVEGGMPRIVDDSLFRRVQEVKGFKRRKDEDWTEFLLSGKVICAACGRNMPGVSGRSHTGAKHEYYACRNCKEVKPVRRDWLEGEVASGIREILGDRDEAMKIARLALRLQEGDAMEARRKAARESLREAEEKLRNIGDAIEMGVFATGLAERIRRLEDQKQLALRELDIVKERQMTPEDFADFLQSGAGLTDADLLEAFVWQVMVSTDEVVVTLNYDAKQNEPARLEIERVRTEIKWCPVCKGSRTMLSVVNGSIYLLLSRAA